jgi:hypothetical protein
MIEILEAVATRNFMIFPEQHKSDNQEENWTWAGVTLA